MRELVQACTASPRSGQDTNSALRIPKPWPYPQSLSPQAIPKNKSSNQHLETRGEGQRVPGPRWPPGSLALGIHPDPDMGSSDKHLFKDQVPAVSAGRMGSCPWPFLPDSLACQMSLCHLTTFQGFFLPS